LILNNKHFLYESQREYRTRTEHGIPLPCVRILVREVGIPIYDKVLTLTDNTSRGRKVLHYVGFKMGSSCYFFLEKFLNEV